MALATKCPHCNTIFRVAHDQLKLRGGIVRCGACNEVFDGNAALVEPAVAKVAPAPMPATSPAPAPTPATPTLSDAPLAFDATMDALDTRAAQTLQAQQPEALHTLDVASADDDEADNEADDDQAGQQRLQSTPEAALRSESESQSKWESESELESESEHAPETPLAPDDAQPSHQAHQSEQSGIIEPAAEEPLGLDLDLDVELNADTAAGPDIESMSGPAAIVDADPESESALEAAMASTDIDLDLSDDDGLAAKSDEDIIAELAALAAADSQAEPSFDSIVELAAEFSPEAELNPDSGLAIAPASGDDAADGRREPTLGEPPSEHLVAAALADNYHDDLEDSRDDDAADAIHAAEIDVEAQAAATIDADATRVGRRDKTTEAEAEAEAGAVSTDHTDDEDEPGFVKRDRRRQKMGKAARVVMASGSVALLVALLAQGVGTFRNQLAAELPPLKPALAAICATFGCKIELPTQIDDLSIEPGELQTIADNTYSFTTLLRNGGASAQAWPNIELVLNDNADKPVLRRVFTPRDYLSPPTDSAAAAAAAASAAAASTATPAATAKASAAAKAAQAALLAQGFAPRSEQSVKLYFDIAQLKASGYHIAVFYP